MPPGGSKYEKPEPPKDQQKGLTSSKSANDLITYRGFIMTV